MANDDKDIPISFLLYAITVIVTVGVLIVGGFYLWLR